MTNRKWVAHLWKVVSLHFPYDQQDVSDIALFVKGNLIKSIPITNRKWVTLHILWKALNTSFPMTNREWVALYILWKAVSSNFSHHKQEVSDISYFVKSSLTFFLLTTGSEQHCTFCKRQCHHIFSYDQQLVSDIAHLWRQSHHIFSFDQQGVSHIAHFVTGSLITSFPMTNSLCVILHILWQAVSSPLLLWPTASKWHCTFCHR